MPKTTTNGSGNGAAEPRLPTSRLRAMGSALVARARLASRAGLSFGGKRDFYTALGYERDLTIQHYRELYERGGIARKLVDLIPTLAWTAGGADIVEDPDPGELTEFETQAAELFARVDAWPRFRRADILSRLGRYSVLLLGTSDLETQADFAQPLSKLSGPDDILYLTPRAESHAKICSLVKKPSDPRFGLPEFYNVDLGHDEDSKALLSGGTQKTHWTRVVHIAGGLLDNDVYGEPALRALWNLLFNLEKLLGGGSEATWKRMNPLTLFDLSPDAVLGDTPAEIEEAEEALEDEIEELVHGYRSYAQATGLEVKSISQAVPNFGPNAAAIERHIAGTGNIPHRVLFGTERGELASAQDRSNLSDNVQGYRDSHCNVVVRQFLARLIEYGALPGPVKHELVWPEMEEMSEPEKADVVSKMATANKANVDAGGGLIVAANELRNDVLGKGPIEEIENSGVAEGGGDGGPSSAVAASLRAAKLRLCRKRGLDFGPDSPAALAGNEEPEWRAVHRAADLHMESLARAVVGAWDDGAAEIDDGALEDALAAGNFGAAETVALAGVTAAEQRLAEILPDRLLATLVDGGLAALRSARSRGSFFRRAAGFSAQFDATNPRAVTWAEERSSLLITEIGVETVSAMQALIAQGLAEGIPPRKLAQQIRAAVGLRSDQVSAVQNLITELQAAKPGSLVTRFPPREGLRGSAGFKARIPKSGITQEWLDRQAARYSTMQRNYRARTIARSETMRSANEGVRELWRQGQESGQLPADIKRVWLHNTDRHADRAGVAVGIDEPWPWGTEPGEEVNCFLPGTDVSGAFVAGLKTLYAGPAIEVATRQGHRLRLTPNHPVLTSQGWLPAKSLRKGQQLVCCLPEVDLLSSGALLGGERPASEAFSRPSPSVPRAVGRRGADDDQGPTLIEDVFEALASQGALARKGCTGLDLHGDAKWSDGEVQIVGAERELVRYLDSAASQESSELMFERAGVIRALAVGASPGNPGFQRVDAPPSGFPRGAELAADSLPALRLDGPPLQPLRVGPAAYLDTVKPKAPLDTPAAESRFVGELLHGGAGLVAFDEVVQVRDFSFRGHVFDLQSVTGWLSAGNIITSNCGCAQGIEDPARAEAA